MASPRDVSAAPRAVLLDWDGTLVDNWDGITRALNDVRADHDLGALSRVEVMERAARPLHETFPEQFGSGWEMARAAFYARFGEIQLETLNVLPGTVALLDRLSQLAIPAAILSNKRGDALRREVAHLGWGDRFAAIVGAGDGAADKPDPRSALDLLAGLGLQAGPDVWLVGDSGVDAMTAQAAGLSFVLLRTHPLHRDQAGTLGAVRTVDDGHALAGLLDTP